jgi:cellulose biosynthesis protein BcsQ
LWCAANFGVDGGVKMDQCIFVFLDDDRAYLEMISSYIQSTSYRTKIQLKTFTQMSALNSFMLTSSKYHLLAIKSEMLAEMPISSVQGTCVVLLGENNVNTMEHESIFISKYQPLNQLLDRLLAIYADINTQNLLVPHKTQIISVYSAVGGCGKTTVAANLAKLLSFFDNKVFYLNLEITASASMFPARENQHFAQLLYYIQVNAERLTEKLALLKHYDPLTKVHYLEPLTNFADMDEMSGEAVETLLKTITQQGDYDYIIIDLDHSLHDRITRALSLSQQIIWLVLDEMNHVHKTVYVMKELKTRFINHSAVWLEKIHFVLNKYTGKISNNLAVKDINLSGYLPYIPQWKSVNAVDQLMSENAFHGHLLHWFFNAREKSKE